MARTAFLLTVVLLLGSLLGIAHLICAPQVYAAPALVTVESSNGTIGPMSSIPSMCSYSVAGLQEAESQKGYIEPFPDVAEPSHGSQDEFSQAGAEPLPDDAVGALEVALEDLESLELQVGYADTRSVSVLSDLHNIYTSPVKVNGNDLCLLMVGGGTLLLVDQDVYDRINGGPGSPEARQLAGVVTELGNSLSALAICGLISLKDPDTAYLGANAVAYSGIACLTLKIAFGRARPWMGEGPYDFDGPRISDDYNSMPSGHSATAFALATVLAKQYPEYKYLFYTCASLIALSRICVHAHWPSDVLVGAAIGVWSANQVMGSSRILELRW